MNTTTTSNGSIRAICQFCNRQSAPTHNPRHDIANGWSIAPYPNHFTHGDGSTGDLYTCPKCNARLNRGEPLQMRGEL